ncbi:MAG: TIGR02302 family protein [Alphaproteobacteria bacterium]
MRLLEFHAGLPEGANSTRARRFVAAARALLFWERYWPALWPASGFAGIYAVLALAGVFSQIPSALHAAALVALFGAAGFSLWWNLQRTAFPRWGDAARRVEFDSGLAHRPLSESRDRLAAGQGDELAESLWRAHVLWLLASAKRLRLVPARSQLRERDPRFMRFVVLAAVIAAFVFTGPGWRQKLIAGLTPAPPAGVLSIALNAWLSPPAYTGLAPHAIGAAPTGRDAGSAIVAPEGSSLVLRVRGARNEPWLAMRPSSEDEIRFRQSESGFEAKLTLQSDARVSVRVGGRTIGDWRFQVIPDRHPSIAFTEAPGPGPRNTLKLAYRGADDYGVTRLEARIALAEDDSDMKTQLVKGVGPLVVELPQPAQNKQFAQTTLRDLTGHPYAGMKVTLKLAAIDAAGQVTETPARILTLPERIFTHPLAKALIEQRKVLASGAPDAKERTMTAIDALTIAPERFYRDDLRTYLTMRALYWQLHSMRDDKDVLAAMSYMWDMAVALEEGDVTVAAQALRNAQQALMEALERGASEEEIAALMQTLREALGRYLGSLAQNAEPGEAPPPGSRMMNAGDLDEILKAIEELSRTGARESAQQLLQGLAQLLENLRVTRSSEPSPADQAIGDAVRGLSELMGQQRELLDRTFREQETGRPQGEGLANDQKSLKERLGRITQGLGDKGVKAPENLGRAQQEMERSEQNLRAGQVGSSEFSQQNALEQLRQGARELAGMLTPQGRQGVGRSQDPLGRESGILGSESGGSVKVPQQSDLQRAREILQELRKRAAERNRPKEELDYIDRLLKRF